MKKKQGKRFRCINAFLIWSLLLTVSITYGQEILVTGTVSETNGPLAGATVIVSGTSNGAQADFDGNYTLSNVPSDATLIFSYIGYKSVELPVDGRTTINVTLQEDAQALDEVVVLGYSTAKKSDLTGAVQQITADKLPEIPSSNITSLLAGRLSGVTITNTNGAPGAAPQILVRGVRSINAGNAPLIVVDGTIYNGDITEINPSDIESVNVLKDASSTAIYGFRGANGVIVITTKRGKSGKLQASFTSSYGVYKAMSNIEMQNTNQYVDYVREAFRNTGNWSGPEDDEVVLLPNQFQNFQDGLNTNWHDITIGDQTGIQQNYYFSLSGGNEQTKARMGFGYYDEEYVFPGAEFIRYSFNGAFDHVTKDKKLEFGGNVVFTYSDQKLSPNPFTFLFRQSPLLPAFEEDGSVDLIPQGEDPFQISPLANYVEGAREESEWRATTRLTSYLKYNFSEALSLKLNANATFLSTFYGRLLTPRTPQRWAIGTTQATTRSIFNHYYTFNALLNYRKSFGKHNLNLMALGETYKQVNRGQLTQGEGGFESLSFYNQENFVDNRLIESSFRRTTSLSVLGRAEYNYDNRYYLTGSLRYDGASQLSDDNKYALFPTIGTRWRISEENFFNKEGLVNNLSLRFGIGQAGNQSVDPYGTVGALGSNLTAFGEGPAGQTRLTVFPRTIDSPDLGWEITTTYDFAVEMGMFNNRLNLIVNPYLTKTKDLILERDLPSTSGFDFIFQNIGETEVKGIDINLGASIINTPNVGWDLEGNFTYYEDKLVNLYGGLDRLVSENLFVGEQFQGTIFEWKYQGIWQEGETSPITNFDFQPGDTKVLDVNGDNIIDDEDRVVLGSSVARLRPSLRSIFRFKNFDFTTLFDGAFGAENFDQIYRFHEIQTGRFGIANLDYWTPSNTGARYPRPVQGGGSGQMPFANSSFFVPMDWVKLREITLGYTFGKKFLEAQKVFTNLRFTLSGQNFLLWSNYDWGLDPEKSGALGNPTNTTVVFGIKADF